MIDTCTKIAFWKRRHGQYNQRVPIMLHLEWEDGGCALVWDDIVHRYGRGYTLAAALSDYEEALFAYYSILRSHRSNLSAALQQDLRELEKIL